MKKTVYSLLLSLLAIVALSSCSGGSTSKLAMECKAANALCPQYVDEGLTMTSVKFENGNVVYTCTCDEYLLGPDIIDRFDSVRPRMTAAIIDSWVNDPDDTEIRDECNRAGANVIFIYVGKPSGKKMQIVVPPYASVPSVEY